MLITFLKKGGGLCGFSKTQMSCCPLCAVKLFLAHGPEAEQCFDNEGGYDALLNAIIRDFKQTLRQCSTCLRCVECGVPREGSGNAGKQKRGSEAVDGSESLSEYEIKFVAVVLSIIFDHDISPETIGGEVHSLPVLCVRNMRMLKVVVHLVEGDDHDVQMLALHMIHILIRINPVVVVALRLVGGVDAVSTLLTEVALGRNFSIVGGPSMSQGGYSTASNSTGTGSLPSSLASSPPPRSSALTEHVPEAARSSILSDHNTALSKKMALDMVISATKVLARIAVASSETNASELWLFVIICNRLGVNLNRVYKLHSLWRNGRLITSSNVLHQQQFSMSSATTLMCSNCEVELAVFECTHHRYDNILPVCCINKASSCMFDGLHGLCRECDRVFHKSVSKKYHIRAPIGQRSRRIDDTVRNLQENVRHHFTNETLETVSFGTMEHDAPRIQIKGNDWNAYTYGDFVANVMPLLLHYIASLVDDRRVSN